MPRTALYFNDDQSEADDFFVRHRGATQREVSSEDLRRELRLLRRMGSGSFGVAFLARFRGREWVVKLPRAQTDASQLGEEEACTLDQVLSVVVTPGERERIERDFAKECRNAERVLDAPRARAIRDERAGVGQRLMHLTEDEYDAVCAARLAWQSLRGYEHMHPVIHYDAELPLLMSLPAEDTIAALRVTVDATTMVEPPPVWFDVAWQLSEAIAFLQAHPRLAHIDLKPANVLFVRRGGGVHCWLSDYGDLFPLDDRTRFEGGTALFGPHALAHARLMAGGATYGQRALYAYYATLVDLLKVKVHSGWSQSVTPDWHLTACLSEYGYNIGECVENMGDNTEEEASVAPPEFAELKDFLTFHDDMTTHLLAPLRLEAFGRLATHFEATRAWLAARKPDPNPMRTGGRSRLSVFSRMF